MEKINIQKSEQKPNFKDGSIVNLMSSIGTALGKRQKYGELKFLRSAELKKAKNILLLVIDGLGYEYIKNNSIKHTRKENAEKTVFEKYLRGGITSVFPSTTATAITTFTTGVAPQQHAITGWFMYLKEAGAIIKPLPFTTRIGGFSLTADHFNFWAICNTRPFSDGLKVKNYMICPTHIVNSEYNKKVYGGCKRVGYNTGKGMFSQLTKAVKENKKRKFIYAYWPLFDSLSHKYGNNSKKTRQHFKELVDHIELFLKKIKGTSTTVIITADHGFVDSKESERIDLAKHPKLKECLLLPLCGEPRAAYCYVRPDKIRYFERYVKTKLSRYCTLYKTNKMIKQGWFGKYATNPKLSERTGDYIIVMKEKYVIGDALLNQDAVFHVGNHGGASKEEMMVPLVVINC